MPARQLPPRPSLEQLKNQAKDLLKAHRSGDSDACARIQASFPHLSSASPSDILRADFSLQDAQLVLAREYGFDSWPRLKGHVEGLQALDRQVTELRKAFAEGDLETRKRLLAPAHARDRFENYDPEAETLSEADARLLLANEQGFALWRKYESYLHLDPDVRDVLEAARRGDLKALEEALQQDPTAANPRWVSGYQLPDFPNDSIPLVCVSEAVYDGELRNGREYEIAKALLDAGADPDIQSGEPLMSAVSFNATHVVRALLDGGAAVDGVDSDGLPMAYAMHFGLPHIIDLLSERGAKLDLRFAAGVGDLSRVKGFFNPDGSLKPGAGALADPYTHSQKRGGKGVHRCERTRENILLQAFYFACRNGRLHVADHLLGHGVNVNAIVPGLDCSVTTLHWCSWTGWLGAGGDPAAQERRCLDAVRFLLEHGADPTTRAENDATPMRWASTDKIRELLRQHGAKD
jgi:ankyrin repeat protein